MFPKMSLVALITLALPGLVLALGADHPRGPVGRASYWPDGLQELANCRGRVHGFFVNAEDFFFYAGETKALNEFLRDYARLKDTKLEVVLHVGRKRARLADTDRAGRNGSIRSAHPS